MRAVEVNLAGADPARKTIKLASRKTTTRSRSSIRTKTSGLKWSKQ